MSLTDTMDFTMDEEKYEAGSKEILKKIRPQWKPENIKFTVFTEGITNKLFRTHEVSDTNKQDAIVFRIYGKKTELLIDRASEIRNMKILHKAGLGAPFFLKFTNGIAYGFVPGECLDEKTVRDPNIADLIACEMATMHAIDGVKLKEEGYNIDMEPFLFKRLREWLSIAPDSLDDPQKNEKFQKEIRSKAELLSELEILERHLVPLNSKPAFCHNDLLLKNIVYNKDIEKTSFIDYEYGAFNYRAHDIGNHFCEYIGIETIDVTLYPDKEYQLVWLRRYLGHEARLQGRDPQSVTDRDVEQLYVTVNKFALAAHFFWGIWAIIQSKYSAIDFDFLDYAVLRFGEYFKKKDKFLALQMSE